MNRIFIKMTRRNCWHWMECEACVGVTEVQKCISINVGPRPNLHFSLSGQLFHLPIIPLWILAFDTLLSCEYKGKTVSPGLGKFLVANSWHGINTIQALAWESSRWGDLLIYVTIFYVSTQTRMFSFEVENSETWYTHTSNFITSLYRIWWSLYLPSTLR